MMPEDDEEEEDSSLAEGFADLSESDNAPFDLTGKQIHMSENYWLLSSSLQT